MSERKKGATSVSLEFRLTDVTTGAAKTALDVTTLKLQYHRPTETPSTATALTLLAAQTTAYTAYGAKEVDAASSPGVYRVDCPDAAFAGTPDEVTLTVNSAAIQPSTRLIDLTAADMRDGVRLGLTALPNAAAAAAGGLPTFGTGTGQVNPSGGKVPATLASTDVTGNVAADLQTIKTQTVTAAAGVTFPTSVASPTNITAGTIATVTTLTNLPAVPTDWLAAAGVKADAVTKIQAGLATPTNITAGVITTATNLTNAPSAGDFTAAMKTSLNAATPAAVTGNVAGKVLGGGSGTITGVGANANATQFLGAAVVLDGNNYPGVNLVDVAGSAAAAAAGAIDANVIQVNGSAAGVAGLAAMGGATFLGVVSADSAPTTTTFTANTTGSTGLSTTASEYVGSVIAFYAGTNAPLARKCTAYSVAGSVGTFTLDAALPAAPGSAGADKFLVLGRG